MIRIKKIGSALVAAVGCFIIAGCPSSGSDKAVATTPPGSGASGGSGNSAPTISGNPPSAVLIGENYSFQPSASDADGDTLTFAIVNKPDWAQFNESNGVLSGTPSLGNVGTYANIEISVSDGSISSSMPPFSIDVTQVQLGSVTLSWTAPTQNSDGSPLNDLDAYKIYYGNTEGSYPNNIRIDNSSVTTYVVENLSPNTYFFVATAVNSQGIESEFSNLAQISID